MYEGPPIPDEDIVTAYVVINGSLGMSTGKTAAQVWHTGWRFYHSLLPVPSFLDWWEQGQRVAVRIAETEHLFNRVMQETQGVVQQDEGMNEVERGAMTVWVTIPYARKDVPKILNHKKIQNYDDVRGLLR